MRCCAKCNKAIPKSHWNNGKKRFTSIHRKYCYNCSPFGKHNTSQLHINNKVNEAGKKIYGERQCPECGRKHNKRGFLCTTCCFKRSYDKRLKKVQSIVGDECWICGYKKTFRNLAFHHVFPADKIMTLSSRELRGYKWETIYREMKKCCLVCHNCHGEIHEGIITSEQVEKLLVEKWQDLREKGFK